MDVILYELNRSVAETPLESDSKFVNVAPSMMTPLIK